ncbi:hypothetical protein [Bacteroides congonensis]|uniref:hypothetical protein n=1 Tax=Bacteroides congonensis TaxID=1871006 RepID=UPI0018A06C70|nr:hypothetical protein [Bacteroides congonensis]
MWKNIFVFIVSLHVFDLYSQNINHYSGTDMVFDFANEEVVLKPSWIKSKEELNSEFVSSLEPDRLLHNFKITAQLLSDAKPLEGWEYPQILYKCQQKHGNGYLSAFPADAFDTLEREFGHVWAPVNGFAEGYSTTIEKSIRMRPLTFGILLVAAGPELRLLPS